MFCTHCGKRLAEDANFCASCGTRVVREDVPAQGEGVTASSMEKSSQMPDAKSGGPRPLMVLNASRKDGLLKRSNVYLVFYPESVVIAELTAERQKEENRLLSARLKEEGQGMLKSSMAMMQYWSSYGNRFYDMTAAEVLNEERGNVEIMHRDMLRVVFSRLETSQDSDNHTRQTGGGLELNHRFGKISATHQYSDVNQNIKRVLDALYGSNLKYRGSKVLFSRGHREGFI